MLVSELIEALQRCRPEAEVHVVGDALKWPTVKRVRQDVYDWFNGDSATQFVVELHVDETD